MARRSEGPVRRFVQTYKGVEEFYFLNRSGELGYIKSGELRSVKETFPQLKDREFVRSNPAFIRELEQFLRELAEISTAYLDEAPRDMELGYVLPASGGYQWRTSTLVLHKYVLEALKADHEMMVKNGTKSLAEAERDLRRLVSQRSIHQGLDELTNHRDIFGQYRYFPALFLRAERAARDDERDTEPALRVINLRWRGRGLDPRRHGDSPAARTRELVFSVLRDNLTQRGAIDRSQRLENRLKVVV